MADLSVAFRRSTPDDDGDPQPRNFVVQHKNALPDPRPYAVALVVCSVLTLAVMLHHPTISASGTDEVLVEIQSEQLLTKLVHGAMMVLVMIYHQCFSVFSAWLGAARSGVALAQLCLHLGLAGYLGAALVSGFVVPGLASRVSATAEGVRTVLVALYSANQALAELGTIGFGAAITLWGLTTLRMQAGAGVPSIIGIIGIIAGPTIVFGLVANLWSLNVTGMTLVVVILSVWACATAAWLWQQPRGLSQPC
ncbi:MAG: hypothetical protein AAGI88_00870 [Pseudomonadota bacterium]